MRRIIQWLFLAILTKSIIAVPRKVMPASLNYGTIDNQELPNIIFIIADDMGWNDVSFHGSDQIPTPNIDALAYNGVILNSHYVAALCTPSRSALLTGKLPIHTGMQHLVILEAEPRGLPLSEKLLPQYLKEAGYSTHAIGKWHQGFHRHEYTPTYRGFDSHFGYWQGLQDYYTHEVASSHKSEGFIGFDMRRNMSVARDTYGKYSTDLFTDEAVRLIDEHQPDNGPMFMYFAHLAPHSGNDNEPLQAPDDEIAKFSYIHDPERRIYAAMMSKLDWSVGEVVSALRRKGMLQNSIIVFIADNGAATQGIHYNRGSNYPFRGIKASAWEGAVHGAAAVWSPLIHKPKRIHNELMYIADWLPTLLSAAGLSSSIKLKGQIDGVDMWPSISGETTHGPRSEILVNIDPIFNYSAIRRGEFKYILGTVGNGDEWYGETGRSENSAIEGLNPTYDPENVLMSKTGAAISGLLTARQVNEIRGKRNDAYNRIRDEEMLTSSLLTTDELLKLRSMATIHCTVPESERIHCNPLQAPCLFNIREDPCEQRNLADIRPAILATLEEALMKYRVTAIPASNVPNDPKANPALWNGTWINWMDSDPYEFLYDIEVSKKKVEDPSNKLPGPVIAVIAILLGLAVVGIFALLGLRCNRRYNKLKKKQDKIGFRNSRHFQEVSQHDTVGVLDDKADEKNHTGNKILENFTNETRDVSSIKNLEKNIE